MKEMKPAIKLLICAMLLCGVLAFALQNKANSTSNSETLVSQEALGTQQSFSLELFAQNMDKKIHFCHQFQHILHCRLLVLVLKKRH